MLTDVRTAVLAKTESCVSRLFTVYDRLLLCRMVAITKRTFTTGAHTPRVHPGECRRMFAIEMTAMGASKALKDISNQCLRVAARPLSMAAV